MLAQNRNLTTELARIGAFQREGDIRQRAFEEDYNRAERRFKDDWTRNTAQNELSLKNIWDTTNLAFAAYDRIQSGGLGFTSQPGPGGRRQFTTAGGYTFS